MSGIHFTNRLAIGHVLQTQVPDMSVKQILTTKNTVTIWVMALQLMEPLKLWPNDGLLSEWLFS